MSNFNPESDMQVFWNEEGGSKWVENIVTVESILLPLGERLLEAIAAREGETVLDVGCGGGITSIRLAQQVGSSGKVLGVDVSVPILAVARQRAAGIANLELRQCDAATSPLGEQRFDVISSRFGVMFFDDPVQAFGNLRRSLKPTGRLVFMCWRPLEENPWMAEPVSAAFSILPAPAEKPDPTAPGPFSLGDAAHLEGILQSAGYSDIHLNALDLGMPMGDMEATVAFLLKMGPAADAMQEADEVQRRAVASAVAAVMEKYRGAEGVVAPSATWIVSARK